MEDNTKTDARAETTGEPASHERPYTPPPDNPGSPGQPSRRESLARAREAQQARAAQRIEAGDTGGEPPDISDDQTDGPQPATGTGTDTPGDASDDWERRISGEGLPDDEARMADLDEEALQRGVADRLKRVAARLERGDEPKELAETVDRPDFQDPTEDPKYVPDRYGTPLERRDGTRTPLFDGEPKREQSEQGALGDCGIIATLGAVAEHHPEAIRDCVREGDDGNYQVRLHEAKFSTSNRRYEPTGRRITLTVTPDLPVYGQRPDKPAFADSTSTGAAWAPVLEKAIAGTDQIWNDERRDKETRIWNARGKPGDAPTGYVRLNQGSNAGERAELLTQLTGRPAKTVEFPAGYDSRGRSADHRLRDEIAGQLSGGKPVLSAPVHYARANPPFPRTSEKATSTRSQR
ncbi:hypothetical protein [Spirillospora sp. NPDC048823]|uniref:hypothetical protein n=1 Tax=Spirillospora sp. NPDC048823 TaxID=3364525 RepID=UPI003723FE9B